MSTKQKKLERINLGELPVFYFNPILESEKADPYIVKVKEVKIKAYQTKIAQLEDYKILKPICKSFKL